MRKRKAFRKLCRGEYFRGNRDGFREDTATFGTLRFFRRVISVRCTKNYTAHRAPVNLDGVLFELRSFEGDAEPLVESGPLVTCSERLGDPSGARSRARGPSSSYRLFRRERSL